MTYVLEKHLGDGSTIRAELAPDLTWSGDDDALVAACRNAQEMIGHPSPANGDPAAYVALMVAAALELNVVSGPSDPKTTEVH